MTDRADAADTPARPDGGTSTVRGATASSGGRSGPAAGAVLRPTLPRMLFRGARRRCVWCRGRGAFFTGFFARGEACRTCGLRWRRGDVGYELGAAAVAAIIVLGPLVLALGAVIAITWPDVEVVPMLAVFFPLGLLLPVLLYPVSYTIWQAIDVMMRPPIEPDDFEGGAPVPAEGGTVPVRR